MANKRKTARERLQNRNILKGLLALSILLFFLSGIMLFIWQGSNITRTQLPTPMNLVVEKVDDQVILSFNPVANVSGYVVKINDMEQSVNPRELPVNITPFVSELGEYDISVKALGGASYKNSDYSNSVSYMTYMILQNPVPENSVKDNLLAWFPVPYADYYKVLIDGFDPIIVEDCEYDYSQLQLNTGNTYNFQVVAYSNNQFIEDSSIQETPISIKICLSGKLSVPQNLSFDTTSKVFTWGIVDNARDYTVYITKDKWENAVEVVAAVNHIDLSGYMEQVGSYELSVKANGFTEENDDLSYQFLGSEKSNHLSYTQYETLLAPQNLTAVTTASDIILSWDEVENAERYFIELLSEENDVFYSDIVYTSSAQISRNITQNLFTNLRVRVSALGFGFYLNSEPCETITVRIKDQMATPKNLKIIENAGKKVFVFDAVNTNASGSIQILQHNGYSLRIQALNAYYQPLDDGVVFDLTTNTLDVTDIIIGTNYYAFTVQTKEYGSFIASEFSDPCIFKNKIQLSAPQNCGIELRTDEPNNPKLVYYWLPHVPYEVPFYELKLRTDTQGEYTMFLHVIYNSNQNQQLGSGESNPISSVSFYVERPQSGLYAQQLEQNLDREWAEIRADGKVYLCVDVNYIYKELYPDSKSVLECGQAVYCSVRAFETMEDEPTNFYASEWSPVVQYINYIQLETPQILSVTQRSNTNISLRFSLIENAKYYLVQVRGVDTGKTYRLTTLFSTTNIYSLLSPGGNLISVKAIGKDYCYDSEESDEVPFVYNVHIEAPNDVSIYYDADLDKYYAIFSNVQYAEFYKVRIKQRNNRDGSALNTYTILDEEFEADSDLIVCDITDYISANGYGEYVVNVQADSSISNAVASSWSRDAEYINYEQFQAPDNLAYDSTLKLLSWDAVVNATNGYDIQIYSKQDGVYFFRETTQNSLDFTDIILLNSLIGDFEVRISVKAVLDKYYSASDLSDALEFKVYDTLAKPYSFTYYPTTKILTWNTDSRSDYDSVVLSFQNADTQEQEIYRQANYVATIDFTELFNEYGFGWYRLKIVSQSVNELLLDSDEASYEVINYSGLNAPTLISVDWEKGSPSIVVKFSTVSQGSKYTVLASADGQDYTEVFADIPDTAKDINGVIMVDIYDALANTFATQPGTFYIAVRADAYDYFSQSNLSNAITCDLYLKHTAPTGLNITDDNGVITLSWDDDASVEEWRIWLNRVVSFDVDSNTYDLTDYVSNMANGLLSIIVRANENGYWLDSDQSRYNYVKNSQLATPTLVYNDETQVITITGDDSVDYTFDLVVEFDNNIVEREYEVDYLRVLTFSMRYLINNYGIGNYSVTVKQLGDGVYWLDSEESEALNIVCTSSLGTPENISIKKESQDNGGTITYQYYLSFDKPENIVSDLILTSIKIYEVPNALVYDLTGLSPVAEIITKDNQDILLNVPSSKYYVLSMKTLGYVSAGSKSIYDNYTNFTDQDLVDIATYLSYLEDSTIANQSFSTYGEQLQMPLITDVEITEESGDNYLNITFEMVADAETYSISIARKSNDTNIYQNASFDGSELYCTIDNVNSTITIKVDCDNSYADVYDGYEITLKANTVMDGTDVKYNESLPKVFTFNNVHQFGKPTLELNKSGNVLQAISSSATGVEYVFFVTINGVTDTTSSVVNSLDIDLVNIGEYRVQVQLIGTDEWHLDSEISDAVVYMSTASLGAVEDIELVASYDIAGNYVQLYAQWEAVENALEYGVLIKRGANTVLETSTTDTSFDLLSIVKLSGMGYYTIWVKTNDINNYILGEQNYSVYESFNYRLNLLAPEIMCITAEESDDAITYTMEFTNVPNAQNYTLNFYDGDGALLYSKIILKNAITTNSLDNNIVVLDDYLLDILGGQYTLKLRANETDTHNASEEGTAYVWELWKKYDNANLLVEQNTNAVLTVSFDNLGANVLYSLYVNGELYLLDNEEQFTYPSSNITLGADVLNVGGQNTFVLIAFGNTQSYVLDTSYEYVVNMFTFELAQPSIISIVQENNIGIGNDIIISFSEINYATIYYVYINNVKQNLQVTYSGFNIGSLFAGLLPTTYQIRLQATNENLGLTPSLSNTYNFKYELKFESVEDLSVVVDDQNVEFNATWTAPDVSAYSALCTSNGFTMPALNYEIKLYYGTKIEARRVNTITTTNLSYDLVNVFSGFIEPGNYIVTIRVAPISSTGVTSYTFEGSEYVDFEFEHYDTLPAPTNVVVSNNGGIVYVSFTPSVMPACGSYVGSRASLYYYLIINGQLLDNYAYSDGNPINITNTLRGGDNLVQVVARSDNTYFYESEYADSNIYRYSANFKQITGAYVLETYISSQNYSQKILFTKPNEIGLTWEDISALTYTITYSHAGGAVSTETNVQAEEYNEAYMYIDVSHIVNNTAGPYVFTVQIEGYEKDITIQEQTGYKIIYGAGITSNGINYTFVQRADPIYLGDMMYQVFRNNALRDEEAGLILDEMYLYFLVNFNSTYLSTAGQIYYEVELNGITYSPTDPAYAPYLVIPTSELFEYTINGKTGTCAKIDLLGLLGAGYDLTIPRAFRLRLHSIDQGGYSPSILQNSTLNYYYKLKYDTPKNLAVQCNTAVMNDKIYLTWTNDWDHDNSLIQNSKFDLTITSLGIPVAGGNIEDYHNTATQYYNIVLARSDFGLFANNEDQFLLDGVFYYCVDNYLFAGLNQFDLFVQEDETLLYIDSDTISIDDYEYNMVLPVPAVTFTARAVENATVDYVNNVHGANLFIQGDVIRGNNYNKDVAYEIVITSQAIRPLQNASPDIWINFELRLRTVLDQNIPVIYYYNGTDWVLYEGSISYYDGTQWLNVVLSGFSGAYNFTSRELSMVIPLDFPAGYSVVVKAISNPYIDSNSYPNGIYTIDSSFAESQSTTLTYATPVPTISVNYISDGQVRPMESNAILEDVVLTLGNIRTQNYFDNTYWIDVYLDDGFGIEKIKEFTISANVCHIAQFDGDLFEYMRVHNGKYTFVAKVLELVKPLAPNSSQELTLYTQSGETSSSEYEYIYKYYALYNIVNNFEITENETETTLRYFLKWSPISNEITNYRIYLYDISVEDFDNVDPLYIHDIALTDFTMSNGFCQIELTDYFATLPLQKYNVTIKGRNNTIYCESRAHSIPALLDNALKWSNPNITITQDGTSDYLVFTYDNENIATRYNLVLNSRVVMEQFTYPQGGEIIVSARDPIFASQLHIGSTNTFTLVMLADQSLGYRQTTYTKSNVLFIFKLNAPTNIAVVQDNEEALPNSTNARVMLSFSADSYSLLHTIRVESNNSLIGEITVPHNSQSNIQLVNIYSLFVGVMPGEYSVSIMSENGSLNLIDSNVSTYNFTFVLRFKSVEITNALEDGTLVQSGTEQFLNWNNPANFADFANLANSNSVSLGQQTYQIRLYYTVGNIERELNSSTIGPDALVPAIVTGNSCNLSSLYNEPGRYRVEIYVMANGAFSGSTSSSEATYIYTYTLGLSQNITLTDNGDNTATVSFDTITMPNYTFLVPNIRYAIIVNDVEVINGLENSGANGVDVSQYLYGGQNTISVRAYEEYQPEFLLENTTTPAVFKMSKTFHNPSNLESGFVYIGEYIYHPYIYLDADMLAGINENDVGNLEYEIRLGTSTYTLSPSAFSDGSYIKEGKIGININSIINRQAGLYDLVIRRMSFSKDIFVSNRILHLTYGASGYTAYSYAHKEPPLPIEIFDSEIYDAPNHIRVDSDGKKITDFVLYWNITLASYLWQGNSKLDVVYFDIELNGIIYSVGINTDTDIVYRNGQYMARYDIFSLLNDDQNNINLSIPNNIKIRVRTQAVDGFASSAFTVYYEYFYHLKYDLIDVNIVDLVDQNYANRYYVVIEDPAGNLAVSSQAMEKIVISINNETYSINNSLNLTLNNIVSTDSLAETQSGDIYYDSVNKLYYMGIDDFVGPNTNLVVVKADKNDALGYLETTFLSIERVFYVKLKDITLVLDSYGEDSEEGGLQINISAPKNGTTNNPKDYNIDMRFEIEIIGREGEVVTPFNSKFIIQKDGDYSYNITHISGYNISNSNIIKSVVYGSDGTSIPPSRTIALELALDPGLYTVRAKAIGMNTYILDSNIAQESNNIAYKATKPSIIVEGIFDSHGILDNMIVTMSTTFNAKSAIVLKLELLLGDENNPTISIPVGKANIAGETYVIINYKENSYTIDSIDSNIRTSGSIPGLSAIIDEIKIQPGPKTFVCHIESVGAGDIAFYKQSEEAEGVLQYSLSFEQITRLELYTRTSDGRTFLRWQAPYLVKAYRNDVTFNISINAHNGNAYARYGTLAFDNIIGMQFASRYSENNYFYYEENAQGAFFYCAVDYLYGDTLVELYPGENDIIIVVNELKFIGNGNTIGASTSDTFTVDYYKTLNPPIIKEMKNYVDEVSGATIGISVRMQKINFSQFNKIRISIYDSQDNEIVHEQIVASNFQENGFAMVVDEDSNVFVVNYTFPVDHPFAPGIYKVSVQSVGDAGINPNGRLLDSSWTEKENGAAIFSQKLSAPSIYTLKNGEKYDSGNILTLIYDQVSEKYVPYDGDVILAIDFTDKYFIETDAARSFITIRLQNHRDNTNGDIEYFAYYWAKDLLKDDNADIYYINLYEITNSYDGTQPFAEYGAWEITVSVQNNGQISLGNSSGLLYGESVASTPYYVLTEYQLLDPELSIIIENNNKFFKFEDYEANSDTVSKGGRTSLDYDIYYAPKDETNPNNIKPLNKKMSELGMGANNKKFFMQMFNDKICGVLEATDISAGIYWIYFKAIGTGGDAFYSSATIVNALLLSTSGYFLVDSLEYQCNYNSIYIEVDYRYTLGSLVIEQLQYDAEGNRVQNGGVLSRDKDYDGEDPYPSSISCGYTFTNHSNKINSETYIPVKLVKINKVSRSNDPVTISLPIDSLEGISSNTFNVLEAMLQFFNYSDSTKLTGGDYTLELKVDATNTYWGISSKKIIVRVYHRITTPVVIAQLITNESNGEQRIKIQMNVTDPAYYNYSNCRFNFHYVLTTKGGDGDSYAFDTTSGNRVGNTYHAGNNGNNADRYVEIIEGAMYGSSRIVFKGNCIISVVVEPKHPTSPYVDYYLFRSLTGENKDIKVALAPEFNARLHVLGVANNETTSYNVLTLDIGEANNGKVWIDGGGIDARDSSLRYRIELTPKSGSASSVKAFSYPDNSKWNEGVMLDQLRQELSNKYDLSCNSGYIVPGHYVVKLEAKHYDSSPGMGIYSRWTKCQSSNLQGDSNFQVKLNYRIKYFDFTNRKDLSVSEITKKISQSYDYGDSGRGCVSRVILNEKIKDAHGNIEPVSYQMQIKVAGTINSIWGQNASNNKVDFWTFTNGNVSGQGSAPAFYPEAFYTFSTQNSVVTEKVYCVLLIYLDNSKGFERDCISLVSSGTEAINDDTYGVYGTFNWQNGVPPVYSYYARQRLGRVNFKSWGSGTRRTYHWYGVGGLGTNVCDGVYVWAEVRWEQLKIDYSEYYGSPWTSRISTEWYLAASSDSDWISDVNNTLNTDIGLLVSIGLWSTVGVANVLSGLFRGDCSAQWSGSSSYWYTGGKRENKVGNGPNEKYWAGSGTCHVGCAYSGNEFASGCLNEKTW